MSSCHSGKTRWQFTSLGKANAVTLDLDSDEEDDSNKEQHKVGASAATVQTDARNAQGCMQQVAHAEVTAPKISVGPLCENKEDPFVSTDGPGINHMEMRHQATAGANSVKRRKTTKSARESNESAAIAGATQKAFKAIVQVKDPADSQQKTDAGVCSEVSAASSDLTRDLTVEVLSAALLRFRVPATVCPPGKADEMLKFAAKRLGVPPDHLSLEQFQAFVASLGLKVTRDGRVW